MTHRIGGPLYVLQKQFEELCQGRIPKPRRLRKRDEFKELFATYKEFVGSYASRQNRQREKIEGVMKTLRSLRASGAIPSQDIQRIENQLNELQATITDAQSPDDSFETPSPAYDHSRCEPETVGAA